MVFVGVVGLLGGIVVLGQEEGEGLLVFAKRCFCAK
jgi:hypothetical protein